MKSKQPIDATVLRQAVDVLRAVAHPLRLRILEFLEDLQPRCVSEIQEYLKVRQSATSSQLALLRDRGILAARRDGVQVYYRVANAAVCQIIECIRTHQDCFKPR